MSIDVIERRRAVEERLRRARNLAASLENATADLITDSGRTMDDLDPDGSLRTAVASLAASAPAVRFRNAADFSPGARVGTG